MAYRTLGLGVGLGMLFLVSMLVPMYYDTDADTGIPSVEPHQTSRTDMKRLAISIPYEFLMESSEEHVGEIVRYEGSVVQVMDQPFGPYMLRVGITDGTFTPEDIIWLNYEPESGRR